MYARNVSKEIELNQQKQNKKDKQKQTNKTKQSKKTKQKKNKQKNDVQMKRFSLVWLGFMAYQPL